MSALMQCYATNSTQGDTMVLTAPDGTVYFVNAGTSRGFDVVESLQYTVSVIGAGAVRGDPAFDAAASGAGGGQAGNTAGQAIMDTVDASTGLRSVVMGPVLTAVVTVDASAVATGAEGFHLHANDTGWGTSTESAVYEAGSCHTHTVHGRAFVLTWGAQNFLLPTNTQEHVMQINSGQLYCSATRVGCSLQAHVQYRATNAPLRPLIFVPNGVGRDNAQRVRGEGNRVDLPRA
jgi:hypothetical protein